jgi:hypothetical protein
MQPDDKVDLSPLDMPDFERSVSRILAVRKLRGMVTRRAAIAAVLVAAAAILLWLSPPKRAHDPTLAWAVPGATPDDILSLGGSDAQ